MPSLRTLSAVALLFVMTGCAATASDESPEANEPANVSAGDEQGANEEAAPSVETDRVEPTRKAFVCKKASDC